MNTTTQSIHYRKIRKYKYKLAEDYTVQIDLTGHDVSSYKLRLTPDGMLSISKRYAWDGPSGPTIDTRTFMRGSLVHDALYQLMREDKLDHKQHRNHADRLLRRMCRDDKMCRFRAWYVYWAVHLFGGCHARPDKGPSAP